MLSTSAAPVLAAAQTLQDRLDESIRGEMGGRKREQLEADLEAFYARSLVSLDAGASVDSADGAMHKAVVGLSATYLAVFMYRMYA